MKNTLIFFVTFLLVSFSIQSHASWKQPQTGDEFRAAVSGKRGGRMTTHMVNRDYKRVLDFFTKKAKTCLNVTIRSRKWVGYVENSVVEYNLKMKRGDSRSTDFTLQMRQIAPRGIGPKMPKDGYYVFMADFKAEPGGKTKVNLYGARFGYKKLFRAAKAWSEGQDKPCPKMFTDGTVEHR